MRSETPFGDRTFAGPLREGRIRGRDRRGRVILCVIMNRFSADERSPSPSAPSITPVVAVVVSYNSTHDLPACLASLEAQRGRTVEIHVVDNASSDGSADLVRRDF